MDLNYLMMRQAHPNFFDAGQVTSQAFIPTKKDENQLSCYDGIVFKPEEAYNHFTGLGFKSAGVYGLISKEVNEVGLTHRPEEDGYFPGHVVVDFGDSSDKLARKLGKRLRDFAEQRGRLFISNVP